MSNTPSSSTPSPSPNTNNARTPPESREQSILKLVWTLFLQVINGFLAALFSPKLISKVFSAWRQSSRIYQCVGKVLKLAAIAMGFELIAIFLFHLMTWVQLQSYLGVAWGLFWTVPTSLLHTMLTSFWMKDLPVPQAKGVASSEEGSVSRLIAKLVFYSFLPLLLPVLGIIFQLIPLIGSLTSPIVNSYIIGFYTVDTLFTRRLEGQQRSRWVEKRWAFLVGMALPGCLVARFLPYVFSVVLTNCWWLYLTLLLYCDSSIVQEAPYRLPVFRYTTAVIDWIVLRFWKNPKTTSSSSTTNRPTKKIR